MSYYKIPFRFTSLGRLIANYDRIREGSSKIDGSEFEFAVSPYRVQIIKDRLSAYPDIEREIKKQYLIDSGMNPVISMMVNPNSVRWVQSKRSNKVSTLGGTVYFNFTDRSGRNNDILTLTFNGNTGYIGNIETVSDFTSVNALVDGNDAELARLSQNNPTSATARHEFNKATIKKLNVWHDLYAMTREPVELYSGVKNEFYIQYSTMLFPNVLITGFFSNVMQFTESADKPFARDYSFSFTVTDAAPDLDSVYDSFNHYSQESTESSVDTESSGNTESPGGIVSELPINSNIA